jgi:hypothetical protein
MDFINNIIIQIAINAARIQVVDLIFDKSSSFTIKGHE